jgi:hypothetical protein
VHYTIDIYYDLDTNSNTYLFYEYITNKYLSKKEKLNNKIYDELRKKSSAIYENKKFFDKGIKKLNNFKGLSKDNTIKKMDFELTKLISFFGYKKEAVISYNHSLGFIDKMFFVNKENEILILYNLVNWKKINKRIKYFVKIKRKLKINSHVRNKKPWYR